MLQAALLPAAAVATAYASHHGGDRMAQVLSRYSNTSSPEPEAYSAGSRRQGSSMARLGRNTASQAL